MQKIKILLVLIIVLLLNGCVSMKYPKWAENGFTSEYDIYEWQRCGVNNPKIAMSYKSCGIERYKVCGFSGSFSSANIGTPLYSGVSPEKACQWNPYMWKDTKDMGSNKLILINEELLMYIESGITPQELTQWEKVFKDKRISSWISREYSSNGKVGISKANLVRKAKKNNLTPDNMKKWANINMLQGWKYIDEAGEWKKYGITFDELSSAVKYIMMHENQFRKTTPKLAREYKNKGYKFKAIYFGLENDISVKDLSKLKDNYNIEYKHGIVYLKYFSLNDIIKLHRNFEANKYYFEKNVKYAKKLKTMGISLLDIGNWIKYYKIENENDATIAISYYKNGLSAFKAQSYKEMYIGPESAKNYETRIQKQCKSFTWSSTNPFDMKDKCLNLKSIKQSVLINKNSAIYTSLDSWIKINSKSSAPKYFSGVVKISGTTNFTTPSGLNTIIPIGKVIVNY